jgi:hypothetical protein
LKEEESSESDLSDIIMKKITAVREGLNEMIKIVKQKTNFKEGDLMNIVVNHPDLWNPISTGMSRTSDINNLLNNIQSILTSNQDLDIYGCTFNAEVVNMPRGATNAKRLLNIAEDSRTKKSITSIKNKDNLCCPRAVIVGLTYHTNIILGREYDHNDIRYITYLKPKDSDTKNPSKYRPITCLPTIYKIMTSCIKVIIYDHCQKLNILNEEQKGCVKECFGCKEQLIIDTVIMEQARKNNRNIYTAFIDYKKAYDSVPHSWLIKILKIYKINLDLINFLSHVMTFWRTTLNLSINNTKLKSEPIQIKRGIYQGDSLSPLWFCLAINPLTNLLNSTGYGFNIRHNNTTLSKLNHLLYMDDIKLYASKKNHILSLLTITENFSNDISMSFGIDKCKTQSICRGNYENLEYITKEGEIIKNLNKGEFYKYLGINQSNHIQHSIIKENLEKQFYLRIKSILKSKLNGNNLIKAVNTYAVPLLTYSFGIIKWSKTNLQNINIQTRVLFTKFCKHHPKSAIERFNLPRENGGRGFSNLEILQHNQIASLKNYFLNRARDNTFFNALVSADKGYTPLNLSDNIISDIVEPNIPDTIANIKQKSLHGRYFKELEQPEINIQASHAWLKKSNIHPETEGFIFAIQDRVINTRNYKKHICGLQSIIDKCRICGTEGETIEHIISSCTVLAQSEYKKS